MRRLDRMAAVDAWLRSGQSTLDYAGSLGLGERVFLAWVLEYGQPAAPLTWIPVRIREGGVDRHPCDETHPVGYQPPNTPSGPESGSNPRLGDGV